MRRKIMLTILCIVFTISLAACGSEETADNETTAEESTTDEASQEVETKDEETTLTTAEPSEEAIKAAQDYLAEHENFRDRGDLIASLETDGYSTEEATAAAENCGADWQALCIETAENCLNSTFGYTYDDLVEELEWGEFTEDEIKNAIATINPDWNEQAVIMANEYLSFGENRDRANILEVLKISGFTDEQAEYGADNCDGYWNK